MTARPIDPTGSQAAGVVQQLHEAGVIAVIRASSIGTAERAVQAIVAGGVTAIEITYSTPNVPAVLRRLASSLDPRVVLGAGTITRPSQVEAAADAGARFLVSPGTDDALATVMSSSGLASLTGAFTPTEVMRALDLGAHAVKLFPASTGGVGHLRALRGPFPDARLVPTGGVSADNLATWLAAGAHAVGAAGSLCPPEAMASGDFDEIRRRAAAFRDSLARYRNAAEPAIEEGHLQ